MYTMYLVYTRVIYKDILCAMKINDCLNNRVWSEVSPINLNGSCVLPFIVVHYENHQYQRLNVLRSVLLDVRWLNIGTISKLAMTAAYDWGFNTNIQSQIEYTSAISSFKERFFFYINKNKGCTKVSRTHFMRSCSFITNVEKGSLAQYVLIKLQ